MFDNCLNSKSQGNVGLVSAIAYYGKQGYTISIPLNDSQNYDLIVDIEGFLHKVQVKTSNHKVSSGNYEVTLVSKGGTTGKLHSRVCDSEVDFVFILTGDGTQYSIPLVDIINNTRTITLGDKYNKYRVV